jgi:hypothetical protein
MWHIIEKSKYNLSSWGNICTIFVFLMKPFFFFTAAKGSLNPYIINLLLSLENYKRRHLEEDIFQINKWE